MSGTTDPDSTKYITGSDELALLAAVSCCPKPSPSEFEAFGARREGRLATFSGVRVVCLSRVRSPCRWKPETGDGGEVFSSSVAGPPKLYS